MAVVRAHKAEVTQALVAAHSLISTIRTVGFFVAHLRHIETLCAIVAAMRRILAFRCFSDDGLRGRVQGLVVTVELIVAVCTVDVCITYEFLSRKVMN